MDPDHDHTPPPLMAAIMRARMAETAKVDPEPLLKLYGALLADCGSCAAQRSDAVLDGNPALLAVALFTAYLLLHDPQPVPGLEQIGVGEHTGRVWQVLQENTEDPVLATVEIFLADREDRARMLADAAAIITAEATAVRFGGSASAG